MEHGMFIFKKLLNLNCRTNVKLSIFFTVISPEIIDRSEDAWGGWDYKANT